MAKADRCLCVRVHVPYDSDLLCYVPLRAVDLLELLTYKKYFDELAGFKDVFRVEQWAPETGFFRIPDALCVLTSLWEEQPLRKFKRVDTEGTTRSVTDTGVFWTTRLTHLDDDFETPELSWEKIRKAYDVLTAKK